MTALDAKAVIFDYDGTLALTSSLHFDAFNAAVARQGAQMDRAWYESRTGLDRNDLMAEFAAQHDDALDVARVVAGSRQITVDRSGRTRRCAMSEQCARLNVCSEECQTDLGYSKADALCFLPD